MNSLKNQAKNSRLFFINDLDRIEDLGKWSDWTDWSKCKNCGDEQFRLRKCENGNSCFGHDKEVRECTCQVKIDTLSWGCWSEFSECSKNCGQGVQKRTRECLNKFGDCEGSSEDIVSCESTNCSDGVLDDRAMEQISIYSAQNGLIFNLTHLIVSCVITFLLGSLMILGKYNH